MSGLAAVRTSASPWNLASVTLLLAGIWAIAGVSWESPLESQAYCLDRLGVWAQEETWESGVDQTAKIDSILEPTPDDWSPVEPSFASNSVRPPPVYLSSAPGIPGFYLAQGGRQGVTRLPIQAQRGSTSFVTECLVVVVDTTFTNLERLFVGRRIR